MATDQTDITDSKRVCVLIITGLPGSGKTTCGALLAEELGFPFFDTDEVIESSECKTIKDIFATEGEERFRFLEREVLRLLEAALSPQRTATSEGETKRVDTKGGETEGLGTGRAYAREALATNEQSAETQASAVSLTERIASEVAGAKRAKGLVIACGGGLPEYEGNRQALKRIGTVVFLSAEPAEIAARLHDDGLRPLLSESQGAGDEGNRGVAKHPRKGPDMVTKLTGLLDRRRQAYECADIKIDTTGLSPHEIVTRLQEVLKRDLKI